MLEFLESQVDSCGLPGRLRGQANLWWRRVALRAAVVAALPVMVLMAGCGGGSISGSSSNGSFSISPNSLTVDTTCTGCNNASSGYEQFTAKTSSGAAASVTWSVSGGDASAGGGKFVSSSNGQYVPPGYLTADSVQVTVTATSTTNPNDTASAKVTVTPGFQQALTPGNVALGQGGSVTVTGYIAEVGGTDSINFALANTVNGSGGGQGMLAPAVCTRGGLTNGQFTKCSATYTAPALISPTTAIYIVGTIGSSSSKSSTVVLLNTSGVNSNPADHQAQLNTPVALGSSGGSDKDYDAPNGQITDCCGGTLGALIKDSSGNKYILSNNHVLARSDQAPVGEMIVQPGLIEDGCIPYGQAGAAVTPVGTLTGWVPVKSASTQVDAAIASVNSNVDPSGAILEFGAKQPDGTLAAAPPGTSCTIPSSASGGNVTCTAGKGETAIPNMMVAKSGRTTGLTCASVNAIELTVYVDYYMDCAETTSWYPHKTYTNQIGIEGNYFSDAGDSGSLVVDTSNGEPVGLFFAGGVNASGTPEGVASPVGEVLNELKSYVGNNSTSYSFVGTTDHAVSCLNYGSGTASSAQARTLTGAEMDRTQQAMMDARALVNPSAGILGVATGKSSDRAGEGAVIVYVNPKRNASVPPTIDGVRTEVIPASSQAVSMGTAPQSLLKAGPMPSLPAAALNRAIGIHQQIASGLMKQNPAFFGVGIGQSLDNPQEAALVIYVDRNHVPAQLPQTINGLRTRYIIMERLHVTRSYLSATSSSSHCVSHPAPAQSRGLGLLESKRLRGLNLY